MARKYSEFLMDGKNIPRAPKIIFSAATARKQTFDSNWLDVGRTNWGKTRFVQDSATAIDGNRAQITVGRENWKCGENCCKNDENWVMAKGRRR
jgi:hypothetical protein